MTALPHETLGERHFPRIIASSNHFAEGDAMHVLLVMTGGVLQLAVFVLFGWLWGGSSAAMASAARWFIPLWCLVAAANMWVGVAHAGYTARQEFPILLLNIAVPAVIAALLAWRLSHGS
ncbi:MAG: hypothetical protein RR855_04760 [Comamonas sp.]